MYDDTGVWMKKRSAGEIWEGLFEFPLIETDVQQDDETLFGSTGWIVLAGLKRLPDSFEGPVKHILSHQEIRAKFFLFRNSSPAEQSGLTRVEFNEIDDYPMPRLIARILERILD